MPGYYPRIRDVDHVAVLHTENLSATAGGNINLWTFGEYPHYTHHPRYLLGLIITMDDPLAYIQLYKGGTRDALGHAQWVRAPAYNRNGISPDLVFNSLHLGPTAPGPLRCHIYDTVNNVYGIVFIFPEPIRTWRVTRLQYYASNVASRVLFAELMIDTYEYYVEGEQER